MVTLVYISKYFYLLSSYFHNGMCFPLYKFCVMLKILCGNRSELKRK